MPEDTIEQVLQMPITVGPKVMPNRLYRSIGIGEELRRSRTVSGDWGTLMGGPWSLSTDVTPDRLPHWDARARDEAQRICDQAHARGALAGIAISPPGGVRSARELWTVVMCFAGHARAMECDLVKVRSTAPVWQEIVQILAGALRDDCAIGAELDLYSDLSQIESVDDAVDFWELLLQGEDHDRVTRARTYTTKPFVGIGSFAGAGAMVDVVAGGVVDVVGPLVEPVPARP